MLPNQNKNLMRYWLDLFTGTTWQEFRQAGATVSGFSERRRNLASHIQAGDILLCYLTGVMRWIGALEVVGSSQDPRPIWNNQDFPVRFEVKPLVLLDPECGVPMDKLVGQVAFYADAKDAGKFKGFVRGSPNRFKRNEDGDFILNLLREASQHPVTRPLDPRKLARKPLFKAERRVGTRVVPALVSVPDKEPPAEPAVSASPQEEAVSTTRHLEIQYHLLALGAEMGLEVWVARNDRSRIWNGHILGNIPRMVQELPTQFNEATQRTIELIDVLWLKGNSILAAFEVECTTSIYSGLLRMSDLLSLQPNLDIRLYLVAPDERHDKVKQEIQRPTFSLLRPKPLHKVCGFLSFSKLMEKVNGIRQLGIAASLSPQFLEFTAEYFDPGAED